MDLVINSYFIKGSWSSTNFTKNCREKQDLLSNYTGKTNVSLKNHRKKKSFVKGLQKKYIIRTRKDSSHPRLVDKTLIFIKKKKYKFCLKNRRKKHEFL